MGNYSKDPQAVLKDALQKGYTKVKFQQGKPVLDRELNLLGDLASPQRLAENHFGNGVPVGSNGFRIKDIDIPNNDFTIEAGRCLVAGSEIVLYSDSTYKTQPHQENVTTFPTDNFYVYLHVFCSEITSAQDTDLLNNDDVTAETAIREKIVWEALVTTQLIAASDYLLLAMYDTEKERLRDRRRTELTLAAIRDELNLARGAMGQLPDRLNVSLTLDGKLKANTVGNAQIANNNVSKSKLKQSQISNLKISIAAGAEESVILFQVSRHALLLISAFISSASGTASISWYEFYQSSMGRGIKIKNESQVTVEVDIQASELL